MKLQGAHEDKNVFVVLGVARSGTSAVARGLQALGIELGSRLTSGDEKWNPKGFFEDSDVVYKINGRAFSTLNFAPYGILTPTEQEQRSDNLQEVRTAAAALISERLRSTHHWGFKDPSTVKLLVFWQSLFNDLNIRDHYILTLRHPIASAQSYQKLTGCDLEVGLLLWLMHMVPAIEGTRDKKRIIISYESLLKNPRHELFRIQAAFNLSGLSRMSAIESYVNEFLDEKLQHFGVHSLSIEAKKALTIVPLCITAYDALLKIAHDEMTFDDPAFISAWSEVKQELAKLYPLYCYLDGLLKKNYQLERKVKEIKKSMMWKLLFPVRVLDDALRARRKKSRASRRLSKAYG